MDAEMVLDLCGGSIRASHSEENDIDERINFGKNLISALKQIKELS